jgi:hypothetical protein
MEFWWAQLDKVDGIPYINIVATRRVNGKFVALLCVNRSLEEDVPTNFDQGAMRALKSVQVHQIKSAIRYERNDEV